MNNNIVYGDPLTRNYETNDKYILGLGLANEKYTTMITNKVVKPVSIVNIYFNTYFQKVVSKVENTRTFSHALIYTDTHSMAKNVLKYIRSLHPSPSGQNGRHSGRRHFQMNYLEWNW